MKIFKTPNAQYDEITDLETNESDRRSDRAKVGEFFNGAPPMTDEEAERLGLTVNVNHLFGYTEISDGADQMMARFTKPTHPFTVELETAAPGKAIEWSMAAQASVARVIRKAISFSTHYRGVCGDSTLHGESAFHHVTKTYPLPRQAPLSKLLIPANATTEVGELNYFVREGELTLARLQYLSTHNCPGWNKENIRRLLKKLYGDSCTDDLFSDVKNIEELEYNRQTGAAKGTFRRTSYPVYYFYEKECNLATQPFSLTILLKNGDAAEMGEDMKGGVLYESTGCYGGIHEILHPIFMDTVIGGEPRWHRVMGLGTLNYGLNQATELLICRAQQVTEEGSMNMWKATNATVREDIERILMQHNGIIPEGMDLITQRFEPNYAGLLSMIQFYRQQGSKNARGVTPNSGQSNDQLEVQAVFEQQLAASASNNRSANLDVQLSVMWRETWRRFTNPYIESCDAGYSEVMDFQADMKRQGIPLYCLQPSNVTIRAVQLVGDGIRSKELAAAQFLSANRQQFPPQMQAKITRIITALTLDNYALAEELAPIQETPDVPQMMRAESENAIMMTTRRPQVPAADDIDELHVMQHFPAMATMIEDGLKYQKASFTPPQAEAFQTIGAHVVMHIHRIEGKAANNKNDQNRIAAREFMDQLNKLAQMGQKLLNNMQQAGQKEPEPIDPLDLAKLQLEMQRLSLQRDKLAATVDSKNKSLELKQQQVAYNQMLGLEKNWRDTKDMQHRHAVADMDSALQLAGARFNAGGQ